MADVTAAGGERSLRDRFTRNSPAPVQVPKDRGQSIRLTANGFSLFPNRCLHAVKVVREDFEAYLRAVNGEEYQVHLPVELTAQGRRLRAPEQSQGRLRASCASTAPPA
ncbi:hypothetical protein GCM10010121_094690 [Streptomyces brasiliensis]|uniref:Uncharacterized protein n=1 Tax=Streptomyces brasiliensis TaxID=1954 RepID=A0A917PB40_9ACTN|nr:hypothetical protein GCM10010121_094690 [Streptomyces brasiliensis]